jgi:hypothetical protein
MPLHASDGSNSNVVKRLPQNCRAAIIQFWAAHPSSSVKSPFTELGRHIQTSCGGYAALGYGSLPELLRAAQTAGLLWLRGAVPGGNGAAEAVTVSKTDLNNPSHAMYWLRLGFTDQQARSYIHKANARDWEDEVVGKLVRNSPHFDPKLHARCHWFQLGDELHDVKQTGTEAEPLPTTAGATLLSSAKQPTVPPKTEGADSAVSGEGNTEVAAETTLASDLPTTGNAAGSVVSGAYAVQHEFPSHTLLQIKRSHDDTNGCPQELGLEQVSPPINTPISALAYKFLILRQLRNSALLALCTL